MNPAVEAIPQTTQDFLLLKELLYTLVVRNGYLKVLETGTDVGDSARIFSTALQTTHGELVTVDLVPPKGDWLAAWPIKNIQFLLGNSLETKVATPLDLLFLDSDHTIEHVRQELVFLGKSVRVGGKIVLHDTCHTEFGEGITKSVREFTRQHQLPWTEYPYGHGLAVIEVIHPFATL